jgi:hypothetical protein
MNDRLAAKKLKAESGNLAGLDGCPVPAICFPRGESARQARLR